MVNNFDDLNNRFTYHKPDTEKVLKHERVRAACLELAILIDQLVPEGREKSLAFTKLEETGFWANAGLARGGADSTENKNS